MRKKLNMLQRSEPEEIGGGGRGRSCGGSLAFEPSVASLRVASSLHRAYGAITTERRASALDLRLERSRHETLGRATSVSFVMALASRVIVALPGGDDLAAACDRPGASCELK